MFISLAVAAAVAAAPADCAARIAQAHPAIDHANADWIRAMKAGDAAAIAAAYAADGLFVLPDGKLVVGRAAVEALYAAQAKAAPRIAGGGIESLGTACGDGALVYEWGRGTVRLKGPDGREAEEGGPYLTVWKNVGGTWKIVRNLAF